MLGPSISRQDVCFPLLPELSSRCKLPRERLSPSAPSGRAELAAHFRTWGEGGQGRAQAEPFMGSRLFKVARVGVLDADIYSPLIPGMLGIAATAARSFRLAAPAWKPNVPSPSRQLARGGFLPYGIPRLGKVACQAADRRPPPRIVSEGLNSFLIGWQGALGISATIKLPHSHLIFHYAGLPREDAGACKFLAETGERCGRGSFSPVPFSVAARGPVPPSARAIPAAKVRSMAGPPARLRSSGE